MGFVFGHNSTVVELSRYLISYLSSQTKTAALHGYSTCQSLTDQARELYDGGNVTAVQTWILEHFPVIEEVFIIVLFLVFFIGMVKFLVFRKKEKKELSSQFKTVENLTYRWSVFDLAKTAYEPGHTEAVIDIVEKLHYDVNSAIPSNGLTLFLCACLSGKRELINYLLSKGADIYLTTREGDNALYLATFGVLSSANPDVNVLEDLIKAGCSVNACNSSGYSPLHRAASNGNETVIQTLLKHGADPYKASLSGIYPIDSAINAGNLEAAELLKVNLANPHVWDVVEPHTPLHIKMGLQSPQRKHLMESSRRISSPRIVSI